MFFRLFIIIPYFENFLFMRESYFGYGVIAAFFLLLLLLGYFSWLTPSFFYSIFFSCGEFAFPSLLSRSSLLKRNFCFFARTCSSRLCAFVLCLLRLRFFLVGCSMTYGTSKISDMCLFCRASRGCRVCRFRRFGTLEKKRRERPWLILFLVVFAFVTGLRLGLKSVSFGGGIGEFRGCM